MKLAAIYLSISLSVWLGGFFFVFFLLITKIRIMRWVRDTPKWTGQGRTVDRQYIVVCCLDSFYSTYRMREYTVHVPIEIQRVGTRYGRWGVMQAVGR